MYGSSKTPLHLPADLLDQSTQHRPSNASTSNPPSSTSSSSDEEEGEEETWSDWASDAAQRTTRSLFDDSEHPSAAEALVHDRDAHGVDFDAICSTLALDFHRRTRLVNYIRRQRPSPDAVRALTGTEPLFEDDELLVPVIEDDPVLQHAPAWSDDEGEGDTNLIADSNSNSNSNANANANANAGAKAKANAGAPSSTSAGAPTVHAQRIRDLESQLDIATRELARARALLSQSIGGAAGADEQGDGEGKRARDDDSGYFACYSGNDIHALMIQDKVRTSTYAAFVLTNPALFRDAVVLDVGCGTGILSLFAAQAGAAKVYAVDASNIAVKAREIVKANDLEGVITVIQGKIEDVVLPDDVKVDVIISEWMGYALLYESMLDSVLRARDRFLKPDTGVIAPSQARIHLALTSAQDVHKERIAFWDDVYGFDLSAMAPDVYADAAIDVVPAESVLSSPCVVKDIYLPSTQPRALDFTAPFTLVSSSDRKATARAFVLYFDVFFDPAGKRVPDDAKATVVKPDSGAVAEVWQLGGDGRKRARTPQRRASEANKSLLASFTTGPESVPTHWKQTLFLLQEPIVVDEGTIVEGTLHVRKSSENSRELDAELHYTVRANADAPKPTDVVVQMFKIR